MSESTDGWGGILVIERADLAEFLRAQGWARPPERRCYRRP